MLWKVKYSNILDEEKFIYYPYLDDMGHVTDLISFGIMNLKQKVWM